MTNAIQVENLTKYYEKFLAVDHINFNVEQGEIFGFLGPNGAGKSTTQRMLTTLLTPTEGRILINGHDLSRDSYPAKRQIGLVPEESNVYTELTAWDNLMFTASIYRVPRNERAKRAQELLEMFGLWEKRAIKAENFSKGMRRRLSIAMAVIHKPSLLFLDEPTPGLDAQSIRAIWELIRKMNAEGTTVFLTTHQIEEANQLCGRVAIISHGKIAAIDTPERLKANFRRAQSVEVALDGQPPEGSKPSGGLSGLEFLPGVTTQIKVGDKTRLYTENPSALIPRVVQFAESHNLRIISLNTLSPSLEDVFLEITGGQLGAVSQEEEKPAKRGMGGRK
jgi:ABC-2 type transport system ATP-binding protein